MNARDVLLEGGPSDIPERYSLPDDGSDRLRVPRLNGYEHYEFTGTYRADTAGPIPIHRWIYTTLIAE